MAYHGYLSLVKNFISKLNHSPSILEVGVDTGISYITLASFLARTRESFNLTGVDILVKDSVRIINSNLDLQTGQNAVLIQKNSLEVLPEFIKSGLKFDVILLDGDHNYYTVLNELSSIKHLVFDHSIIVIDDYHGRWSEKDLWYAEREGYENVAIASSKIDTEKRGVKAAVDDWVDENPAWKIYKPISGEPVLLLKEKN